MSAPKPSSRTSWHIGVLVLLGMVIGVTVVFIGSKDLGEAMRAGSPAESQQKSGERVVVGQWSTGARRASATRTQAPQHRVDGRLAIADELVVTTASGVTIDQIARHYGATIVGGMEHIGAYRLQFSSAAAASSARSRMAGDAGVDRIEANYVVTPPPPVQLTGDESGAVLANRNLQPVDSDSPIVIGLVDTQVGPDLIGADGFLIDPQLEPVAEGENGSPTHGSAVVASMMSGMADVLGDGAESTVRILPVDVYDGAGVTTSYQVAEGVVEAIEAGATVINLSLGSDSSSALLQDVLVVGDELGVVFVGAAGNEPVTTEVYPAAYPSVLAVTAVNPDGSFADYANRGDFIDVGAPGLVEFGSGDGVYLSAGTSMATGVVSGMVAAVAETEGISVSSARALVAKKLAIESSE